MKGVVIQQGEEHFTYLKKLFHLIDNVQKRYNWLITAHECYPQNPVYAKRLSADYCFMTGEDLTEMIENEDFLWIWGVFSAFPKNISKNEILKYELPWADGNEQIWKNPVTLQHPLSKIEIIAWDSTLTVLISKSDEVVETLRENNRFAEDLEEYNK